MPFNRRRVLTRLLILSLLGVGSPGCIGTMTVVPPLNCAKMIPGSLRKRVPSATIPAADNLTIGPALDFGDAQTGQLGKANDRGDAVVEIADLCQAEQERVAKQLSPKPWAERLQFWRR
jgi:hypothetical protein